MDRIMGLEKHERIFVLLRIYLSADSENWMKSGITYVLGKFHLEKYLTKLTSYMKDSRKNVLNELRTAIRDKKKAIVEQLEEYLENETGMKWVADAKKYILSNWIAAKLRLRHGMEKKEAEQKVM